MSNSVLVVEDYRDLCSAIAGTLERRDIACDTATSAEDAIGKLRTHHYETILLAPRIPISSDPVMRFLHETQPEQMHKVILMTGPEIESADPDDCRVLHKPFNHDELLAKLDE